MGHVPSCGGGRWREQYEIGSLVGAMRPDGLCVSLMMSLRHGSAQYRRRGGYWLPTSKGLAEPTHFGGIGASGGYGSIPDTPTTDVGQTRLL